MRLIRMRIPRGKSTATPQLARAAMRTRLWVYAAVGFAGLLIILATRPG